MIKDYVGVPLKSTTENANADFHHGYGGEASIAARATWVARVSVLSAMVGAAIFVAIFVINWTGFQEKLLRSQETLIEAHNTVAEIRLRYQRLTLVANLAAATGGVQWIKSYDDDFESLRIAVTKALELASPESAAKFMSNTASAINRIVPLERKAMQEVLDGNLDRARVILGSDAREIHSETVTNGLIELNRDLVAGINADLEEAVSRHDLVMLGMGIAIVVAALLFWRGLIAALKKSERASVTAERKIKRLATKDSLTGVSNRGTFEAYLENLVSASGEQKFAVFMIDLDHFKPVNDLHGHLAGDLVLQVCAQRLLKIFAKGGYVCRYGGDEFAVVATDIEWDVAAMRGLGQYIVRELSAPIPMDDVALQIGASVGISIYPDHGTRPDELLHKADLALYQVKGNGRGDVQLFDRRIDADEEGRARFVGELSKGIAEGEIVPYFQPIVDLETNNIQGFEVVARWNHPSRGVLLPEQFISVAEHAGLIGDLFVAMLRQSCKQGRSLPENTYISINLSQKQLRDDWLASKVLAVLSETGFPARRLEIELTETAIFTDFDASKRTITSLQNIGVRLSLDNFGAGQSSLFYLSELCFARVKIDRSFVQSFIQRNESRKIVNAVVALGDSLGVITVAEGVEDAKLAEWLRKTGCKTAQGFLYSKPVPADQLETLLHSGPLGEGVNHHDNRKRVEY